MSETQIPPVENPEHEIILTVKDGVLAIRNTTNTPYRTGLDMLIQAYKVVSREGADPNTKK